MSARAPRRRRRTPLQDESTRERMLDAAMHAFSDQGFDGTSTREIAARAGVNQGLIPYYFGSKEALWKEAVDRAFAALRRGLDLADEETEGPDDREQVELRIRGLVHFVARNPEFVRIMQEEGKRDGPRMRWLIDRHVRPIYETTIRLIGRARESAHLPEHIDPLHFHYILVGAATLIFHQAPECRRLTGHDPCDPEVAEAHADAVVALMLGHRATG